MSDTNKRPVARDKINFVIWGTGNPGWGDPRMNAQGRFQSRSSICAIKSP